MSFQSDNGNSSTSERIAGVHVAVFVVGVSWAFGGNADWVRTPISLWGTLGILLSGYALAVKREEKGLASDPRIWALPVIGLNAMVALSCLTPGLSTLAYASGKYLMPVHVAWWTPSSARASNSLGSLWLFDGIYFSCLNIALCLKRKRVIRTVLAVVVANALVLSVFGTVQKLAGATGLYFGAVKTPQPLFFSTFVYDNHWGAFTILTTSICIGLVIRYAHGFRAAGFFRGPALTGITTAIILGITIPFSSSRACTILLALLAAVALWKTAPSMKRSLSESNTPPIAILGAISLALIIAAIGLWYVAGDVVVARIAKTKEQLSAMVEQKGIGSRAILYNNTWEMARARPAFGWGMGTFPIVFRFFNTQESKIDHIPVIYHDAHSDWLQSLAEIGFVGTSLIGIAVLLPLSVVARTRFTPIPYFLFVGCILVAGYAWVEFPFGNVAVVLSWWLCFFSSIQYLRIGKSVGASRSVA